MNKEFIAKEIAVYSGLASLMHELEVDSNTFTADEIYVLTKTIELMEKHDEALSELIDKEPHELAKELFVKQAKRVMNMLENMELEGDL